MDMRSGVPSASTYPPPMGMPEKNIPAAPGVYYGFYVFITNGRKCVDIMQARPADVGWRKPMEASPMVDPFEGIAADDGTALEIFTGIYQPTTTPDDDAR